MKLAKRFLILFLIPIFVISFKFNPVFSDETYVYLGGDSIGVKFDTGIIVTGYFDVVTKNGKVKPWKNSDIKNGDQIIEYNNLSVSNNQTLLKYLRMSTESSASLTLKRKNTILKTNIKIVETINEEKSLGLYVKDQMVGIGTLTFVDPITNYFASLGHGVYSDSLTTGNVDGTLVYSIVETIKKGIPGLPGEKRATIENKIIGDIKFNDSSGVYGIINDNYRKLSKIKVGNQSDVHKGKAKIFTVINQTEIKGYDILITDYNYQKVKESKGLKIKIVDQNLIKETGGIVQGMSGSPIVQNGKIIGAVSHVSVNNPLIGYGVYINWMQEEIAKLANNTI